jgi:hypothetical protein
MTGNILCIMEKENVTSATLTDSIGKAITNIAKRITYQKPFELKQTLI